MINEDMNQVLRNIKGEVFRDLRVASQAVVVGVHDKLVDVQLLVADVTDGVAVTPPVVKNLNVVGSTMPSEGAVGVVLHLDRKNSIDSSVKVSGGPAHDISHGVFLPILT